MQRPMLALGALAIAWVVTPDALADWHLRWAHELPPRKPAWEHTPRMRQDRGYAPVLAGDVAVVGCEHDGALLALDADSGEERWRFYTAAPVRFAPVSDDERIYVGSDDGYLYCLDLQGKLIWKRRGGPADRLVIGHERMMSAWPISSRPLLVDGLLYFVAGYWPVDGIHLHAVEAATGETLWSNNALQLRPNRQITLVDGKLMLEGDNSSAVVDARTGVILDEKRVKPPRREPPEVSGMSGTLTGWSQAPSGERLVAGTTMGVYGFSRSESQAVHDHSRWVARVDADRSQDAHAAAILQKAGVDQGYALVAGLEDGALVEALLRRSRLHVVAVEPDASRVDRVRRKLARHRLFDDHRLSVFAAEPGKLDLPPYFATLIVSERDAALARSVRASLRPHGGVLLEGGADGSLTSTRRTGPPDGASDWTHEFCDAANTLASRDQLVRAPLGLLWYGGEASHGRFYFDGSVDHQSGHGLNPQPVPAQIVEGRMILQGPGLLAAVDIYTGRVLWESSLPSMYTFGGPGGGLGIHSKKHPEPWRYRTRVDSEYDVYDVEPTERCRASGFNMVSAPDGVYVGAAGNLLRFAPATGERISTWPVPLEGDLRWGGVRLAGDTLVATLFRPQDLADARAGHDGNGGDWAGDRMPMRWLVALDRHSGELRWSREARWGFLNRSGICVGDGKVFCVDLLTEKVHARLAEAGREFPDVPPRLLALDLETGEPAWTFALDVYVQNIAYSGKHDFVLVPCRNLKEWRDGKWVDLSFDVRRGKRNKNAPGLMRALRSGDGEIAWEVEESPYHTPHIVLDDLLIDRWGYTYDPGTGKRHRRKSPRTGEPEPWSFRKSGCNHLVACSGLVTWRCAYYDLAGHRGVTRLAGMDAGCSPTLLPAGGVLNIPNFGTHHKRNRMTAMALVHRSENELWAAYRSSREKLPEPTEPDWIERAGFNFGASGDRFGPDGTLWLQVSRRRRGDVSYRPRDASWFNYGTAIDGSPIASSGIVGALRVEIPVTSHDKSRPKTAGRFTVRLHFVEPRAGEPGERVFDVAIEGRTVLREFDVLAEAGGSREPVVREFAGVEVAGHLDLELTARSGEPLLCGVEILRER